MVRQALAGVALGAASRAVTPEVGSRVAASLVALVEASRAAAKPTQVLAGPAASVGATRAAGSRAVASAAAGGARAAAVVVGARLRVTS